MVERAPYLYTLLNDWADALVLVVGASVGLAAVIGTLRFLYGWSLKPLIYLTPDSRTGPEHLRRQCPGTRQRLGLAWDTGAVTTGPVTVPLVLSLGIGIAAAAGKGDSGLWSRYRANAQIRAASKNTSATAEQLAEGIV